MPRLGSSLFRRIARCAASYCSCRIGTANCRTSNSVATEPARWRRGLVKLETLPAESARKREPRGPCCLRRHRPLRPRRHPTRTHHCRIRLPPRRWTLLRRRRPPPHLHPAGPAPTPQSRLKVEQHLDSRHRSNLRRRSRRTHLRRPRLTMPLSRSRTSPRLRSPRLRTSVKFG